MNDFPIVTFLPSPSQTGSMRGRRGHGRQEQNPAWPVRTFTFERLPANERGWRRGRFQFSCLSSIVVQEELFTPREIRKTCTGRSTYLDAVAKILDNTIYCDEDVVIDGNIVTAKPWAPSSFAATLAVMGDQVKSIDKGNVVNRLKGT